MMSALKKSNSLPFLDWEFQSDDALLVAQIWYMQSSYACQVIEKLRHW